jgi:hypothetical protein
VAENLAGRAVTLLFASRLRLPAGLADARCRLSCYYQKISGEDMMVQHQHNQQVQLHHGQQPDGCSLQ